MQSQLYRFKIKREKAANLFSATDEHDGASVWIVAVEPKPERRGECLKELEEIANDRHCECFTAVAKLFIVASSESQAGELKNTLVAKGLVPQPPVQPSADDDDAGNK